VTRGSWAPGSRYFMATTRGLNIPLRRGSMPGLVSAEDDSSENDHWSDWIPFRRVQHGQRVDQRPEDNRDLREEGHWPHGLRRHPDRRDGGRALLWFVPELMEPGLRRLPRADHHPVGGWRVQLVHLQRWTGAAGRVHRDGALPSTHRARATPEDGRGWKVTGGSACGMWDGTPAFSSWPHALCNHSTGTPTSRGEDSVLRVLCSEV